jgi:acetyl esterase/lipase
MKAVALENHEVEVEDIEYLRHGDLPLLVRLFKPSGNGPFPLIVQLHGGAWCRGDRTNDTVINEPLAKSGVVVAALDWRMPPVAPYPAALADINYAVRWVKTRAADLRGNAERVGLMGSSSGGHQAMLAAMRPRDSRYAALPLPVGSAPVDASVRCVVMCWPVIDPLGRYHYAKDLKKRGGPGADLADRVLPSHDEFWGTEEAMTARPAATWNWSCSKARRRASSAEIPIHPTPQGRSKKSSTSCTDSWIDRQKLTSEKARTEEKERFGTMTAPVIRHDNVLSSLYFKA